MSTVRQIKTALTRLTEDTPVSDENVIDLLAHYCRTKLAGDFADGSETSLEGAIGKAAAIIHAKGDTKNHLRAIQDQLQILATAGADDALAEDVGDELADLLGDDAEAGSESITTAIALDPARYGCIRSTAQVVQVDLQLRSYFSFLTGTQKANRYVAEDCLRIIKNAATLAKDHPTLAADPAFIDLAKTALKRLNIMQKLSEGQHPTYVAEWSRAVDDDALPTWIRKANQQAAANVKALALRPDMPRDRPGKGARGGGGGGRGGTAPRSSN